MEHFQNQDKSDEAPETWNFETGIFKKRSASENDHITTPHDEKVHIFDIGDEDFLDFMNPFEDRNGEGKGGKARYQNSE